MGICHTPEKQPTSYQINIIYPSGTHKQFTVKSTDTISTLLQQIFEDVPITNTDDKIIPGQQLLISKNNPNNVLKYSEEKFVDMEFMEMETFILTRREMELTSPMLKNNNLNANQF